jgi:hypothetical protein
MNRLDCSGLSGFVGLRGMNQSPLSKGNLSCRGSSRQCHWRLRRPPYRSFLAPIEQSCFISQATTLCTLQGNRRAVSIIDAKPLASAVAEIKFIQIAMQVCFANVLIYAINAALQDREKSFNRVGGDDALTLAAQYSSLLWVTDLCEAKFQPISWKERALSVIRVLLGDARLSSAAPIL